MFKRRNLLKFEQNKKVGEKDRIISTKQSWQWNYVCTYLQAIEDINVVMADKEFKKLYNKLYEYAYKNIALHDDGDITGIYVMVDQVKTGQDTEGEFKKI